MIILFIVSIAVILYTYAGYPIILLLLAAVGSRPVKKGEIYPYVSILLSVYNEEKNIEARIKNLLELDYPREKLEIIVGSDGSTDETYKIIRRLADENNIRYAVSFQRIGKPAMINKMAKEARGDIFVFADARQKFERNVLKEFVKCFADEEVGVVSGELIIQDKEKGAGRGIGLYWNYEKALRRMESNLGSMLGATGAIYAIRQELFRYLPNNVILDDVYIPMHAIMLKKRAIFEPAAKAYDIVASTTKKEFGRKVRTLVGNFQIFSIFSEAFNPFKSKIAFQLFSHKFLRLWMSYFLILTFISNIFLLSKGSFFVLAFFLQIIFYSLALSGYVFEKLGIKISGIGRILFIPYELSALNAAAVVALFKFSGGRVDARWEK